MSWECSVRGRGFLWEDPEVSGVVSLPHEYFPPISSISLGGIRQFFFKYLEWMQILWVLDGDPGEYHEE